LNPHRNCVTMGTVEDDVLAELTAEAGAALALEARAQAHRDRVRELLGKARQAGYGPAELERAISSMYVAKTISRWTADDATVRKPGRRKRPGAAPS
jgi:hypothetical protein